MHHIVLYPQNGDRIVTIEYVTSLHPMYTTQPARTMHQLGAGGGSPPHRKGHFWRDILGHAQAPAVDIVNLLSVIRKEQQRCGLSPTVL